jgi:hypothetical protein
MLVPIFRLADGVLVVDPESVRPLSGSFSYPLAVSSLAGASLWVISPWPSGLGILQANSDFGIAAGNVNSGQRVYHGRGNSTAFSGWG